MALNSNNRGIIWALCLLLVLSCALFGLGAHAAAPQLTPEETSWLAEHKEIRLAPDPDFRPIEYFDENGVYQGAAADIINVLHQKLNLKITVVRLKNWDEVMEKFRAGEVDLLGAMVRTPNREKFALFTETLVEVPGGIFSSNQDYRNLTVNDLAGKKVAVVSNYTAHDVLKNQYPQINLDVVPDVATGLAKASLGMVDAYVENMANATYYAQQAGITNLKLAGRTEFSYKWGIGIRKDWPQLQSILNKGLSSITPEERQAALNKWIHISSPGWTPSKAFIASAVAGALAVLLLVIIIINISLRRAVLNRTISLERELYERKKAQNDLEALKSDLENRVRERTVELEREIYERAHAEVSARESEQKFRALFKSASDPIYLVDNRGRFLDANDQASRELQYSHEELLKLSLPDIDVAADPSKVVEFFEKVTRLGPASFETFHRRKDGTTFPVEVNSCVLEFDGTEAVLGIARNITERKRSEEALRVSERLNGALNQISKAFLANLPEEEIFEMILKVILDTMDSAYGVVGYIDESGSLVCPSMTRHVWSECQMSHKTIVFPKDSWGNSIWGNALKTGQPAYCNRSFEVPTGHVPIRSCLSVPMMYNDKAIGIINVANKESGYTDGDLSILKAIADQMAPVLKGRIEKHAADNALKSFAERMKLYFDRMPMACIVWGCDYRVQSWNPEAERIFGFTAQEAMGKTAKELMASPDSHLNETKFWKELIEGDLTFNDEDDNITKDGRTITCQWTNTPFKNEQGRISGIISMVQDITEIKRMEEEHKKLEQQILHTQKLESMGVLAGGIAHDFNNILMAIIGNADLALMRVNPESPVVGNLRLIEQAAARATDLAKQMLAYSGKGKFVIETINLNQLIQDMTHMLEVSISKKAILRFNLTANLPPIEADATQIRQIVMNLVINASEAIGDKSGVIAISTGCMHCDNKYLRDVWLSEQRLEGLYVFMEVADTGCGMSKETMTKIFDPFFTTKFTGRGLGMAAVLGIIRGHKGAIKIYSEIGKGTTFKILFPASAKPAELFGVEEEHNEWKDEGLVLLVDDEETVRAIGTEMLRILGYEVITAEDGRDAMAIYRQTPGIKFVILDLTMPHMDGEQTFRELRKLDPNVKVIMSSGYNEQEVTEKFLGKGLAGFIQKPYKISTLRQVMRGEPSR